MSIAVFLLDYGAENLHTLSDERFFCCLIKKNQTYHTAEDFHSLTIEQLRISGAN
jgi:hypothetical protein